MPRHLIQHQHSESATPPIFPRLQLCPAAAAALQAVEWPRQLVHIPT